MKVIFLAAGEGTRLRPYTEKIPKCMVPVFDKPIIQHDLETCKKLGIENVVIVGGYKFSEIPYDHKLIINSEYATSNMVYSLFCAADEIEGDVIISYSDIVYKEEVLQALINDDNEMSVVVDKGWKDLWSLRMENPLLDAETLKLSNQGFIIELGKKPKDYTDIEGQYIGLIKISAKAVKRFKRYYLDMSEDVKLDGRDKKNIFMTSFLQYMINKGEEIKPVFVNGGWFEIDSVEDLHVYESNRGKIGF